MHGGFQWLDLEEHGISVAPFFFAASGLAYPLTIEQLQCKTAIDLEFDISQDPQAMGLGIEVRIDRILVYSIAITFLAKALFLSPGRSNQGMTTSSPVSKAFASFTCPSHVDTPNYHWQC